MKKRLTLLLFLLSASFAILAAALTALFFREGLDQQIQKNVREQALYLATVYKLLDSKLDFPKYVPSEIRVTLIDSVGSVLFDSDVDYSHMGEHNSREEIVMARAHGEGESVRRSKTLKTKSYYFAKKMGDGSVIRASFPLAAFDDILNPLYPIWILLIILLFVISLRISFWLTDFFLHPVRLLAEKITTSEPIDLDSGYPELEPFVRKIHAQNEDIKSQLSRLERERLRLEAIVQNMSEGLILLSRSGEVLLMNGAALKIFHVVSVPSKKSYHYLLRNQALSQGVERALAGEIIEIECVLNGRYFQVILNPVVQGGREIGAVCLFIDISERRATEQMRQEFTANVSHELKTPLTSISGYAEIIQAGFVPAEEITSIAGKIRRESARLLELINDIMKLSEVDSPNLQIELEKVDIGEILVECEDSLTSIAKKRNITLEITHEEPAIVFGSSSKLYELVYNLIDNAIRYNKEGGKVTASFAGKKLIVKDTGIGIPLDQQSRVFERFYRVDKSRSKATGGTGLGLAIVKHIAERHGAEIFLKSEENVGTEIAVIFP